MKKFMLRVLPFVLLAFVVLSTSAQTLAVGTSEIGNLTNGKGSDTLTKTIGNVWATIATVLQIVAVAAIVFAGVRYMFAGADEKGEIKQGLIILVVGAVLVFGSTTVVKLIANVSNEVTNSSGLT